MNRASRPAHRTFGRLSLESLEAREVPAVNYWIGDNTTFAEADNWTDGVPTLDDTLVFTAMPIPGHSNEEGPIGGEGGGPPGGGGPPSPPPYAGQSVVFPSDAGRSYAGIRILDGYSGTITFPANISFGEYTQTSGTTAQSAGATLTVTSTFAWTGGAVNATSNVATYKLLGVTGQIGTDTTNLTSGSTFVLDGGTTLTQSGELNLNGSFEVLAGSSALVGQLINQVGNQPKQKATAGSIIKGELTARNAEFTSVEVSVSGTFKVRDYIKVTDKVPGSDWGVVVDGAAASLEVTNGSTIEATNGVYVKNGGFTTEYKTNVNQITTIEGKFRIDDGEIYLGAKDPPGVVGYSTLLVKEMVYLWGGTLHTRMDDNNSGNRDAIETWDQFNIGAQFTIAPMNVGPVAGSPVLVSKNGFTDDVDPNNPDSTKWVMGRNGKNFEVKRK